MRIKKKLAGILKGLVSAGLMIYLYRRVDWNVFAQVLKGAQVHLLVPIYLLLLANTALSAWKWRILLSADGIRVPYLSLLASYWIASFFNLFLPSNIGGDFYRVYDVARREGRAVESFASVFADRFTGFLAIAIWGLLFSVALIRRLTNPWLILLPAALFAGMLTVGFLLLQKDLIQRVFARSFSGRWPKMQDVLTRFLNSLQAYRRSYKLLLHVMLISLTFQGFVIVCISLMGRLLGWQIPLIYFCAFVPLITLIEAIPISIFGIGVRETAYVSFFGPVGVPYEAALALPLLYVALTVSYVAVGGVLFLLRRVDEDSCKRRVDEQR